MKALLLLPPSLDKILLLLFLLLLPPPPLLLLEILLRLPPTGDDGGGNGNGGGRISDQVQALIPLRPGIKYPVRAPPLTPINKSSHLPQRLSRTYIYRGGGGNIFSRQHRPFKNHSLRQEQSAPNYHLPGVGR